MRVVMEWIWAREADGGRWWFFRENTVQLEIIKLKVSLFILFSKRLSPHAEKVLRGTDC